MASCRTRGDHAPFTSELPRLLAIPLQGAPKGVPPPQLEFIEIHCGWLNVLKVSRRNCRVDFSPPAQGSRKSFSSAKSQLFRPGPVKIFRPI